LRLFEGEEASPGALVKLDSGFEGTELVVTGTGIFFPEEKILGPFATAVKGETEA